MCENIVPIFLKLSSKAFSISSLLIRMKKCLYVCAWERIQSYVYINFFSFDLTQIPFSEFKSTQNCASSIAKNNFYPLLFSFSFTAIHMIWRGGRGKKGKMVLKYLHFIIYNKFILPLSHKFFTAFSCFNDFTVLFQLFF